MKNITLSADETAHRAGWEMARTGHKTLNVAVRQWLEEHVAQAGNSWGLLPSPAADNARPTAMSPDEKNSAHARRSFGIFEISKLT